MLTSLQDLEEGVISYEDCGEKLTVTYHTKDLEGGCHPQVGDKVNDMFDLIMC